MLSTRAPSDGDDHNTSNNLLLLVTHCIAAPAPLADLGEVHEILSFRFRHFHHCVARLAST